jgi:hypothetical protein
MIKVIMNIKFVCVSHASDVLTQRPGLPPFFSTVSLFSESERQRGEPSQSQSYDTTNGQSASLSWCQAPIWSL